MATNRIRYRVVSLLFAIIFSLVIPQSISFASGQSSITYSGAVSLTTTVYAYPDEYSYPDQCITRTCSVTIPFAGLTLTSYGGSYSGSVSVQDAQYTSDWTISPSSSTRSDDVIKTYSPASGHTQGTFSIQIYAEITGGVLTFVFNPDTTILQMEMSISYTMGSPGNPGSPRLERYAAPSADAYQVLSSYCNTQSSLVIVPKSSTPFQTPQTITFNGQKLPSGSYIKSYEWTGTVNLGTGSQMSEPTVTPTPTPIGPTEVTTQPTVKPTTPTATPTTGVPVPGTAAGSELVGQVLIKRAGSNTWETLTGSFIAHKGDIIETGAHSRVTVQFSDGAKIHMGEGSYLDIRDDPNSATKDITLIGGLIHLWERFGAGAESRPFKVRAEPHTVSVRGSELTINLNDTAISVTVIEGIVDLENSQTGGAVTLEAGETLTVANSMTQFEMEQNVQAFSTLTIDRWWEQSTQNSLFTGLNLAITIAVTVIAVVAILGVLMIHKRRKTSQSDNLPPDYLPPPPPPPPS